MGRKLSSRIILCCCLAVVVSTRAQTSASQHDEALRALQQGRYPEAASLFRAAIRQAERLGTDDVRLAESLNGLAQVYRYQQNYTAAEPLARRSLSILERVLGPSDRAILPSLVHLAGIAQATDEYSAAEQFYRRILSVRWGTPGVTGVKAAQVLEKFAEVLSLGYTRHPGLGKALDEYWQSISEAALDKDLYVAMRDGLLTVTLVSEAESLMQRATRIYPESRQLHYQLAELYVKSEKYQKALASFGTAARLGPHPDPAVERNQRSLIYEKIAEMNIFLVRFDEAFAALKAALEINSNSARSRLLMGDLYLRRNELDEAAAEYAHVISSNRGIAAAHDGLAQVNLARGRYSESVREADKALEIDPALQRARYVKALGLIRAGREEDGRTVLQEYERREAEQRIPQSRREEAAEFVRTASALLAEDRLQEAIEVLREGVRSHPGTASLHIMLGLTLSRLGLHAEAAQTFETIIERQLDDFLVHRQLSREYETLGNLTASRRHRVLYLQRYAAALQSKVNG